MSGLEPTSLWRRLSAAENTPRPLLSAPSGTVRLEEFSRGSTLGSRLADLRGRAVLLAVRDQLTAAKQLIELDGDARRIILCPPDLTHDAMAAVAEAGEVDAAVLDRHVTTAQIPSLLRQIIGSPGFEPMDHDRTSPLPTEWVLLTSGTSGVPKLVLHTLASLAGPVTGAPVAGDRPVWSTFYDIRRYGGVHIFLRAMLGGGSLVLSDPDEAVTDFLARCAANGVTHISGTPSHWRRALMSPPVAAFKPSYIRLSGEIADQAILDQLRQRFPNATIAHAFASTEAGVGFEVTDGLAGFPAGVVGVSSNGVEIKIEDGSLRIRSSRTASRYLGPGAPPLRDADGYVDTGDLVESAGGRYRFAGRRGGVINVGGAKVYPEEVEAVINAHPAVRMALLRARKNPITGAVVVADIVLQPGTGDTAAALDGVKREVLDACRAKLAAYKVPVAIRFVPAIGVAPSGKLLRHDG